MAERTKETEQDHPEEPSEQDLREELYEQFGISMKGRIGIRWIIPHLDQSVKTESRYNIDKRSKILAEIALYQAYEQEPKFKIFAWAAVLVGTFDLLHRLDPGVYSILFVSLATINGFVSSLRSPAMMAAELEGIPDENGMPADYRAKALSSVNTNITLVLFVIAVGVQLFVTSGNTQAEIVSRNLAAGIVNPVVSVLILLMILLLTYRITGQE
ncbi:hypothetical protein [Halorubrum ezzemoulense]|uniref:hypothetical protein n=1 Tax=Halorubrum ezzemoulense TaxID=337243 RepID=UPI00232B1653|nr:hypothetical protein [Halorubrum ezzemoulense]MDB2243025.1 hypothetical protein [Halorubrum ezzemoulense]